MATQTPSDQEAGSQPACRPGGPLDAHLVPRPGPVQAHGHHPIPEGGVTMSRRPSVSRMRENRTYGSKGGWGTGLARAPRPCPPVPFGHPRLSVNSISSYQQPLAADIAMWQDLGIEHVALILPKIAEI